MTEPEEFDRDDYDDDPPRSLLSALWFRTLLVVLVLGVIAVLAAPSLMDVVSPRGGAPVASVPPGDTATPAAPAPSEPAPAAPEPASPAQPSAVTPPPAPAVVAQAVPTTPQSPAPAAPRLASGPLPVRQASATALAPIPRGDAASGPFWVQVGAFRDPEAARRLAARLREQKYRVDESVRGGPAGAAPVPAVPGPDRYEVFIAGIRPEEITDRLTDKAGKPEAVAGGVVLRPPLPLADALALSRDVAGEGRRVQVRRSGAGSAVAPPAAAAFYRVRVGGFPDRAAAEAVQRELEGKGYRPFIARGDH